MAKYGNGKLYGADCLYGADPQYLTEGGNIPSAAVLGMPTVNPGAVTIYGVGNISGSETFGTAVIYQIPQRLVLALDIRRFKVSMAKRYLLAVPQITSLQVTPDA